MHNRDYVCIILATSKTGPRSFFLARLTVVLRTAAMRPAYVTTLSAMDPRPPRGEFAANVEFVTEKCQGPTIATSDLDPSTIFKDQAGYEYTPGTCFCNAGLATALFDIIAQGLSQLDNVICAVMVSAFESVVEIGLDMTPEAWVEKAGQSAAEDAIKAAVQGAKVCVFVCGSDKFCVQDT